MWAPSNIIGAEPRRDEGPEPKTGSTDDLTEKVKQVNKESQERPK